MNTDLLIMAVSFLAVSLLAYGLMVYFGTRREIQERFAKPKSQELPLRRRKKNESALKNLVTGWLSAFGEMALGKQPEKSKYSGLRMTLIQAGFRHPNALAMFYGLKALSTLLIPAVYFAVMMFNQKVTTFNLGLTLLLGGVGYYLPNYLLNVKLRRRQEGIDRTLPDVLDLMIVSLEAGLSLQSTLNHVAEEVRNLSRDLHRELLITNAELRTGIPRDTALKNLGERTGVQSVKSLVALMIQSEKMGVSIAHSLRTHADFVRVQRAQKAEELAAKMPIKIIFPTLFCIFPAIFIVILGPAAIQIYKSLIKR